MKTSLTQKQLLQISRQTGMSFFYTMSKKGMMEWVEGGLNGYNEEARNFALAVVEADKQLKRDRILKELLK
jgi:hypothetical protein